MGKGVTNLELLRRAMKANGEAQQLFQQLTTEPPPATVDDLYARVRELRNLTRSAACATQEVKNRIKARLLTAESAESAKEKQS